MISNCTLSNIEERFAVCHRILCLGHRSHFIIFFVTVGWCRNAVVGQLDRFAIPYNLTAEQVKVMTRLLRKHRLYIKTPCSSETNKLISVHFLLGSECVFHISILRNRWHYRFLWFFWPTSSFTLFGVMIDKPSKTLDYN